MTQPPTLEDLLDDLGLVLQRGTLDQLAPLTAAITAELACLPALDAPRAEGLRRRALRNDACLQAAARGVRAAIARIAGLGNSAQQLSTYGADGRKRLVGDTNGQRAHRI